MKQFANNVTLGMATFGRPFKHGEIAIGAAILGGATAIGSTLGLISQSKANKTNINLAHEANDLNYQMWQEQNAENWKMFDATNSYNSPVQQRVRLEQAGLNPALMMQKSGTVGSASAMSAPSSSAAIPGQVSPLDFQSAFGDIGQSISQIVGLQSQHEDVINKRINNLYQDMDWQLKLDKMRSEIKDTLARKDLTRSERTSLLEQLEYNRGIRQLQRDNLQLTNADIIQGIYESNERINNLMVQSVSTQYNDWLKTQHLELDRSSVDAQNKQVFANIRSMDAQNKLTEQQVKESVARENETWLRANAQYVQDPKDIKGIAARMADKQMELYDYQIRNLGAEAFSEEHSFGFGKLFRFQYGRQYDLFNDELDYRLRRGHKE